MRKILSRVIICCLFVVVGVTGTAAWSDPAVVGPDDPDYIANVIEEALRIGAVQDPAEKILLLQQMLERRIDEIEIVAAENKPGYIPGLVRAYETILTNIEDTAEQATDEGRDVSEALDAVERSTKKHTEVLTALLEKIPDQARSAIEHAIEVSKRGRNTALDRLRKIQEGDVPRGRPEGVGKPEKPGKPDDAGPPENAGRP